MSHFCSYQRIPLLHSVANKAFALLDIVSGGDGDGDEDDTDNDQGDDQDPASPFWWTEAYSSDEFRMYEFKVRRCVRTRTHDWTDCPFAHPGEKARRRDPRRYHYSGDLCPLFRRDGSCIHGDTCDFAHGVFECWLHPSRYRTMPCKDGKRCRRKVCFFAHTSHQLRLTITSTTTTTTRSTTTSRNHNKPIFLPKPASTTGGSSSCSPASISTALSYTSTTGGSSSCSPASTSTALSYTSTTGGSSSCSPASTSTALSYTSPPPSPPVSSPILEEMAKSMEAMELRSGCSAVGLLWPNYSGHEPSDDEGTVPDLEWVNELVM